MVYLNAHYSVLGDLWVSKVSVSFLQQLDLKNKKKPYNYTDSALMGGVMSTKELFFQDVKTELCI